MSAAVLYVGGRPVAETEYVSVYVVVLHPAGPAQDAHRRQPAAGQDSQHAITWPHHQVLISCSSHVMVMGLFFIYIYYLYVYIYDP